MQARSTPSLAPSKAGEGIDGDLARARSPWVYFALTFALSIPFWLAGALSAHQLLPALPVSALGVVCPTVAAAILVHREAGRAGVAALLKRAFDVHRTRAKIWYLAAMGTMPGMMGLSYVAMRAMGVLLPPPRISLSTTLGLFVLFFVGAIGEELGWTGYAIDPLQIRHGALGGALRLGIVWAVWHFIPLLSAHRSPGFIAWWSLWTVASRILMVWLHDRAGGSVFVAVLFHTMSNLAWMLFPIEGSYYDPRVTGVITAFFTLIVVLASKPSTWIGSRLDLASREI